MWTWGMGVKEFASSTNGRPVVRSLVIHCRECLPESVAVLRALVSYECKTKRIVPDNLSCWVALAFATTNRTVKGDTLLRSQP
jgi:hypothetical protein